MEKIKNILKQKYILIYLSLLFLLIIFIIIMIINSKKVTDLEKAKIIEMSSQVENYLDEIIDTGDEGKYVNFAIEYLYNNTDKKEYSIEEIIDVINKYFDISYTEDKLLEIGISEKMLNKGIVYNSGNKTFKYNYSKTGNDIADTPLVKYSVNKIKKINSSKFIVVYDKYVVEKPYEVLNYYNNNEDIKYDTGLIKSYLKGEGKIKDIKNAIDKDNIKTVGKIDGSKKVTYNIKKDKLLISIK